MIAGKEVARIGLELIRCIHPLQGCRSAVFLRCASVLSQQHSCASGVRALCSGSTVECGDLFPEFLFLGGKVGWHGDGYGGDQVAPVAGFSGEPFA
jgi:hypothetical protein